MKFRNFLLFGTITLFTTSCSNNSTDDLTGSFPLVEVAKYNENVKPIIDANCVSCHATSPINGASIPLVTYQQVKNAVLTGGLINRISRQNGDGDLMPLGGPRMPQNTINVIVQWEANGLLE